MKHLFSIFLLNVPFFGISQFNLYSDFYIASGTEFHIASSLTSFVSGSIFTEHGISGGVVSFAANSNWNSENNNFVDGNIKKYHPKDFIFPSGTKGIFQPLVISEAKNVNSIQINYRHQENTNLNSSLEIIKIHPTQYWEIQNGSGEAKVELFWNEYSNLDFFLDGDVLDNLTLVGFTNDSWELIPSFINPNASNTKLLGSITSESVVDLTMYSSFSLAIKGINLSKAVKVAEGISPNGDGKNDTWVIVGIERFPVAKINVYNRNGENVFEARKGYINDWNGTWKNSGEKLPSGPYFFIIDLNDDGKIDLNGWLFIHY